jgi:aminomethyltransferase
MIDRGIPRQHYEILSMDGIPVGKVTSGTMSPMMNRGIGLGYVSPDFASPGTNILIGVRNKKLKAEVTGLPIYKKDQK